MRVETIAEIEQIHANWINAEFAGDSERLMSFCAESIEFHPPNAPPIEGADAVLSYLTQGTAIVHAIEISQRVIRISGEIACLTARFKTTFSAQDDSTPKQVTGSHLWVLTKEANRWLVTLVSWSLW
jgi:ketosteroid isomerase-like protein